MTFEFADLRDGLPTVEACIAWAAQHGYTGAVRAARELGFHTGRRMEEDQPYYASHKWRDETEEEREERHTAAAEEHAERGAS